MNIEDIKAKIYANQYVYTQHAEIKRKAEGLTFIDIEKALLNGKILECYPDTGRGECCLIAGFSEKTPVHAVCGWRGRHVAIITVYIPSPPKFVDPYTRGDKEK